MRLSCDVVSKSCDCHVMCIADPIPSGEHETATRAVPLQAEEICPTSILSPELREGEEE